MSEHSAAEQREFVRNLYRTLYEEKSFDAVSDFYAPGAVRHGGLQGIVEGQDAIRAYLRGSLGGLSDIEVTELRWLAEDDLIAYDFEMTATHSGPVMDVPATGNPLELTNTVWFRIEDGLVVDEWPRTDILGLLEGIGVVDLPS
jgi:predicted ester cyclase